MTQMKSVVWYLLASVALSAAIYGSALWGGRMLAPLDIGPDLFKQFKFMDPAADGIPQNHHIIDQFTYDLPLQYAIYGAYHAGEIPWWDPYTYGGRPLLADAHVNGTDPVRLLCYAALPFEAAYNWNYILRGILTGLGMFVLLRALKVNPVIAGILALTYQYAGWFTLYWGHPWIEGSFLYFPYLWVVWLRAMQRNLWVHAGLGGLLCGLVFYAGNLQSHIYLVLFALGFLGAALMKAPRQFHRAFGIAALSGVIGGLLAAPVLFNQVEFFFSSARSMETLGTCAWYYRVLAVPFSLGSYYPWMFGTFKTLDVGHVTKMNGMGFQWFCGIGGTFLALWGGWALRRAKGELGMAVCQSCLLILMYLCVVSTPLVVFLYSRCSALAGMGLIILAALAAQAILEGKAQPHRWLVRTLVGTLIATSIATSALAWWVYPLFKTRIEAVALDADKGDALMMGALRRHQVDSFAQEVSLRNPEAAITLVAVALLAFALTRRDSRHFQTVLTFALLVSAVPVVMFHVRFRPSHPVALWQRLAAGGPAQNTARSMLAGGLRLDEAGVKTGDALFPLATAAMYHVHVVQGYSALQPCSLHVYPPEAARVPKAWRADYFDDQVDGVTWLRRAGDELGSARFRLQSSGSAAAVRISAETHNLLTLDASTLPAGESIVRTDTYYPGWNVKNGASKERLAKQAVCFSLIPQANAGSGGRVELEYTPTYLPIAVPCFVSGLLCVAASLLGGVLLQGTRRPLKSKI